MIEPSFTELPAQQPLYTGPLATYIDRFAALLTSRGYAESTARDKLRLIAHLSGWLQQQSLPLTALDERRVEQFLSDNRRHRVAHGGEATCRMLLSYLREFGSIPPPVEVIEITPVSRIERDYTHYLVAERGLTAATVTNYIPTVERFLKERFGTGEVRLGELAPRDVHHFLLHHAPTVSRGRAKLMVTALRSFFGFLRQRGEITRDLAGAIPTVPDWRLTGLPRPLGSEQVEQMLASCDRQTVLGQRDYAILLLLARLGLRAGEVVALTLDDLDWEAGTLTVRGKGDRQERLPLPQDVGAAVANYLHQARPRCATRRVFIRLHAPHSGFSTSVAIDDVVRRALVRAGLDPACKGAHLLRHALATRLLGSGASLEEIGQLLRHAHAQTTEIYAKVDLHVLRALAQPWPGGDL